MYIAALIQLADGTRKIVEASGWGMVGAVKFMSAIGDYAKKENKLVKVVCDDVQGIGFLRKSLHDVTVEYGVPGILQFEEKKEAKKNAEN